jgi:acylphosphatase
MLTYHLIIQGRVQGVFYRASAKDKANELGIKGWIRNLPDGNVEAMISGDEKETDLFMEWCRQGPRGAKVTSVDVHKQSFTLFERFRIVK